MGFSVTNRLFKLPELETACEDLGQAVKYIGGVVEEPAGFTLDDHHYFPKGKIMPVCGNTWMMLHDTRFKENFEFFGNFDNHYGIYEGCGEGCPFTTGTGSTGTSTDGSS